MRNLIIVLSVAVLMLAVGPAEADVIRLSEPVAATATSETYAAQAVELPDTPPISLAALMADAPALAGQEVVVTTRIARVCQKKGCFFIAQEGADSIRVSFKDYAFFVPTDSSGKKVTLVAELVETELTESQAAHYREDLGDGNVVPGRQFELVASAVQIPK